MKGPRVRWTVVTDVETGGEADLPEIELRIAELQDEQRRTDDDERYDALSEDIRALRKLRRGARESLAQTATRMEPANFFEEDWAAATTDIERTAIIRDAIARIHVTRGGRGQKTDAAKLARLTFDWKVPEDLGPIAEVG